MSYNFSRSLNSLPPGRHLPMGLLPDTQNCGLRMRRDCRERFLRHRLQRQPLVSDPGMHHGTCVTHVPWCMSGSLFRDDGENVLDIPGACATRNSTYLAGGPWVNTTKHHWGRVKFVAAQTQVMDLCFHAAGHHPSPCRPKSILPHGVHRSQCVKFSPQSEVKIHPSIFQSLGRKHLYFRVRFTWRFGRKERCSSPTGEWSISIRGQVSG